MLFLNISSIYLRCGLLIDKSDHLNKEFDSNKGKLQYINPSHFVEYKSKKLFLFEISFLKIDNFAKSFDFKYIAKFHQDEPIYYNGNMTKGKNEIITKIFSQKMEKFGNQAQLAITGIDYINNNIENSFFNLPKEAINKLVIVGDGQNNDNSLLTKNIKNKINLKDKLYPYLLTIGTDDLTVYKVDSVNSFAKLGYNSLGPTSLWSLLNLTCNYDDTKLALSEVIKGNNELIDLSVGDIYGGDYAGVSLCSELIACSFSKVSNGDNINKVNQKDIGKAIFIFYGVTYAQVAAMVSSGIKVDKNIICGDTFESFELIQLIQNCLAVFNGNTSQAIFNDYSNYFSIIGMIIELDKLGLIKNQ